MRRAFLCGVDQLSGRSCEHRRGWIEDRLRVLSSLFRVQICAYAVMSNHYHLVVRPNPTESDGWSDHEVLQRWTVLYSTGLAELSPFVIMIGPTSRGLRGRAAHPGR